MELNSFYNLYVNDYVTNLILVAAVTGATVFLAIIMPIVDGRIAKKSGVSLNGGVSGNPHAIRFLRIRKGILLFLFLLYLLALVYVVLLARGENPEYRVNNSILEFADLKLFDLILPRTALIEFYLNTMLFIPMGYLLPYLFRWFRMRPVRRPLITCFFISLGIENVQLLLKRGYYDTGDILANTLGGLLGLLLFLMRAYTLTDPDWKRNLRNYRRWRRLARNGTLFPFSRRLDLIRTTIFGTNEEEIFRFYVEKMGFQLRRQLVPENTEGTSFLFGIGRAQLEIRCSNEKEELPEQSLIISFENLDAVRRRLLQRGIDPGDYMVDPFTGQRMLRIFGPDHVKISMVEY